MVSAAGDAAFLLRCGETGNTTIQTTYYNLASLLPAQANITTWALYNPKDDVFENPFPFWTIVAVLGSLPGSCHPYKFLVLIHICFPRRDLSSKSASVGNQAQFYQGNPSQLHIDNCFFSSSHT
jgi:hypothetical protein